MDFLTKIADESYPPFFIAELSGNHGGNLEKAFALLEAAVEAGADAIKLQTYKPDTITVNGRDTRFLIKDGLWAGKYLHDLYELAMTPWEWHVPLAKRASELGSFLFSSPFDESAVEFLESSFDPPVHKIASFELNHYPLLEKIGQTGKPVIASAGVSSIDEIGRAIDKLMKSGCPMVSLLHCVSEYPAEPSSFNLLSMNSLSDQFDVPVGISDHSLGHTVAVTSTALGARIIEKHFTLDRDDSSIDGKFSMLPKEYKEMVAEVKSAHSALGMKQFYRDRTGLSGSFFKRSILVSSKIRENDLLTEKNIRVARPGDGLCPSLWKEVLGAKAIRDMEVGHPLKINDFKKLD